MGAEKTSEQIHVTLPHGSGYPIWIDWGCLPGLGDLLRQHGIRGEVFLLSDRTVWSLYGRQVEEALQGSGCALLDHFLLEEGEESKSIENWRAVLDRLVALEDGTSRQMFLLNLGGGVVGDLGGFAAATYRRGIPFVQVPTTLLAQVDSSVGGKTGVNHPSGKNLIGAFYQPSLVVVDLLTLRSLPDRQVRSGLVEVVKVGLIWDASFFRFLEDHLVRILGLEREPLRQVVSRSCAIKAEIVSQDEREKKGVRTLLNFGHTFGHALEAATGFSRLTHGEAVAIGILCAAWVSVTLGMLARSEYDRIENLLKKMGMDTRIREVDANRVWEAMKRDKKFLHGRNRFVLLEGAGRARIVENVDAKVLGQALEAHLA